MKKLPSINDQFSDWYNEVIYQAELVDTSPTKGAFVLPPYGYALWENIKAVIDKKIKQLDVPNVYLPLLIPEEFLKREAKHVEGFAPEVAVVTHAGGKKLEEPYVIRPTSETMVYYMFAKWIKSWRDLPLKINQWANVVRWEMRTRPFLRTSEFLWQEGHTAHATFEDAEKMAIEALAMYKDFAENYLAIPVITGQKSESERFAGADRTYTYEGIMHDGKALQMGTSHLLAQSFSSSFDVKYQDKDGNMQSPYCTSWCGATPRVIGAVVMTHGDENGLIMPPKIAPIQVVIVPIYRSDEQKELVLNAAQTIKKQLENLDIRVKVDTDEQKTPGAKFFHWEMRGVPIRMELGPRDIEGKQAVLVDRLETDKAKKKSFVNFDVLGERTVELLDSIQTRLFKRAQERLKSQWHQAEKLEDFCNQLLNENGAYQVGWCESPSCEEQLKKYHGTIRCVLEQSRHKSCFACDKASVSDIIIAKAY